MNQRHRVAVVIPRYGSVGGAEGFAAALTRNLTMLGEYEIHVFAYENEIAAEDGQIIFHRLPHIPFPRPVKTPGFAWLAQSALNRTGVDLIHAHDRMFNPDIYNIHGVPHLFWARKVRGKVRPGLFDHFTAWVERKMVYGGKCRYFLAVSHLAQEVFLREYPIDPERVPVVHPGVDVPDGQHQDRMRKAWRVRARYNLPPDCPLLLFVSMNFYIKGLDYLLAALGRIIPTGPGFHLLVVGGDRTYPYERIAHQGGLLNRVTFTGSVSREELPALYSAADLYIMPSRFDTFGMVVLEAMAWGVPAVISETVGAKDLLRRGENGFVVHNPADSEALADVIRKALHPELNARMKEAAMETARHYSWKAVAERVAGVYLRVLDEKRS